MTATYPALPTWRAVATRIDLLRSTGPRHAWRRWQQDRALRRLAAGRRAAIARSIWSAAARELGATVTVLDPTRLEIRKGPVTTRVSGQSVPLNAPTAVELAADKTTVYELLAAADLPVPEHLSFLAGSFDGARVFLERGPVPCLVKPARGSGGDGIAGEIRTSGELRRAALSAARFGPRLLIERQVAGLVLRLLVLDGEVLDVLVRNPPSIVGDGHSTVEELVFAEYDRRLRADGDPGVKPFAVDLDCLLTLAAAGLSLRSVPPAGAVVRVKTVTNYNRAEENETLRGGVAAELRANAGAAAGAVGLRLAGVDVITPRPDAELAAGGGVVVDVNATPALHHHAHVADPQAATPVAVPILRALLEAGAA